MRRKRTLGADSPHRGLVYPHKVGLTSHIRHGNFVEVWWEGNRIEARAAEGFSLHAYVADSSVICIRAALAVITLCSIQ
jgi:hypothetical protein